MRETGWEPGDLILVERGEETVDVGFRQANNGCAAQKRDHERGTNPMAVMHGHQVTSDVVRS